MEETRTPNEEAVCHIFPKTQFADEITEEDHDRFFKIISTDLTPWQVEQVITPFAIHHRQEAVLAVHWHPEFVPMDLIKKRVETTFPNRKEELLIPTQHNELMSWNGYTGVEVDCYASGFNSKVQLLLHFTNERVRDAEVLKSMLALTGKYRSSQLFDFIYTITKPMETRIQAAAMKTGADGELIEFVRIHVAKIEKLLDDHWTRVPRISVKNKLLRNWFDALRPEVGELPINRVQAYLKAVKAIVKTHFPLTHFYRVTEIIEETRGLGGCVVIPHPEEFWPILLADYDIDGIETWNPQSQRYTKFLISVVNEQNRKRSASRPKQLIFMGDDCHMGEKTKPKALQDPTKIMREIGYQPAWDDLNIRKALVVHGISRRSVIREYKERLAG